MIQVAGNGGQLDLPFRPFTLDEVQRMVKCPPALIDRWAGRVLVFKTGADGFTQGLSDMQAFAIFVGFKYLTEGAGYERADPIVLYVGNLEKEVMMTCIKRGSSFIVIDRGPDGKQFGALIPISELGDSPLVRRLNLKILWAEFWENMHSVFGKKVIV